MKFKPTKALPCTRQDSCIPQSQESTVATKKKSASAQHKTAAFHVHKTAHNEMHPRSFFPLGLVPPSRSKWGRATEDRPLAFCWQCELSSNGWQCELSSNEIRTVSRDQGIRGRAQGTWLAAMSDALATSTQLLSGRTLRRAGRSNALRTGGVPSCHERRSCH